MGKKASDFILDTGGMCFLCFHRISNTFPDTKLGPNAIKASPNIPNHSIQCLSRFLKVDMGKVVHGEEENEQHSSKLLAKVKESKLKVELCEKCVNFNNQFSKLYLGLEKMKLEMVSLLGKIQPKLEKLKEADNVYIKREAEQPNLTNMQELFRSNKLEVAEVIREEVKQKCKLKLVNNGPRVKLPIIIKYHKIKSMDSHRDQMTLPNSRSGEQLLPKIELEDPSKQNSLEDDEWSCTGNMDLDLNNEDDDGNDSDAQSSLPNAEIKNEETVNEGNATTPRLEAGSRYNLPKVDKSQSTINLETGHHKCVRCSMEFKRKGYFLDHFRRKHLSFSYKCESCGKGFSSRSNCTHHQQHAHVRQKFECRACNKTFSSRITLKTHWHATHLGTRFKCKFCPKTFTSTAGRSKHKRKFHTAAN